MKQRILLVAVVALLFGSLAHANGVGNGGDPNEPIFMDIATNIEGWIASGNADGIQLPSNIPLVTYKQKMLSALANYHISFTQDKVTIGGAEKTCENYIDTANQRQIVCNSPSFTQAYQASIDNIYRLVHHEFAGLADLEVNSGQDSDYKISDQISAYLKDETVPRLPIDPPPSTSGCQPLTNSTAAKMMPSGSEQAEVGKFVITSRHRNSNIATGSGPWINDGIFATGKIDFKVFTSGNNNYNIDIAAKFDPQYSKLSDSDMAFQWGAFADGLSGDPFEAGHELAISYVDPNCESNDYLCDHSIWWQKEDVSATTCGISGSSQSNVSSGIETQFTVQINFP